MEDDEKYTITLDSGKTIDISDLDTTGDITINLNDTFGATTTYVSDSSYTISLDDTITISDSTFTLDTHAIDWTANSILSDTRISPDEVERMCKEYPALEKVWRNFKSVYDMVQQDYKGKKKSGELEDDIPF